MEYRPVERFVTNETTVDIPDGAVGVTVEYGSVEDKTTATIRFLEPVSDEQSTVSTVGERKGDDE